jgi:hypothetical protein
MPVIHEDDFQTLVAVFPNTAGRITIQQISAESGGGECVQISVGDVDDLIAALKDAAAKFAK